MLAKGKAQTSTTNEEVDLDELLDVSVFSFPFFSYSTVMVYDFNLFSCRIRSLRNYMLRELQLSR
jgi:hypothetical protein